jgi:hypothetical protein
MKTGFIIAASAVVFAAAAPANAQADCKPYEKLVSAYAGGFQAIMGEKTDSNAERDGFKTTLVIPGAGECGVYETKNWRLYQCHREFEVEKDARTADSVSFKEMLNCLAGWEHRDFAEASTTNGLTPLAHTRFVDSKEPSHPNFEIGLVRRDDVGGHAVFFLDIYLVSRRTQSTG